MHSRGMIRSVERVVTSRFATVIFLFTAAIIFLPVFRHGSILLSGTDSLYVHFPNLLFGNQEFHDFRLALYNPYIFAGTDFTTSMHYAMLNPIHWPLLLLPTRYVLHGITVMLFLEYFLVGWVSFKALTLLTNDRWLSCLGAITIQLSGYMWFTTTGYITTPMTCASVIAIYLIVSADRRSYTLTCLYLTFCLTAILTMGHVAYQAAFILPIVAAWLMKISAHGWRGMFARLSFSVATAGILALMLSAYRLVPVLQGLLVDTIGVEASLWWIHPPGTVTYFTMTSFVPFLLGYDLFESLTILKPLNNSIRHIQSSAAHYYGIIAIYAVTAGLIGFFGRRAMAAAVLCIACVMAHAYTFQPVADMTRVAIYPFIHEVIFKALSVFFFGYFVVEAARALARMNLSGMDALPWRAWFGLFTLTLLALAAFWTSYFHWLDARPIRENFFAIRVSLQVLSLAIAAFLFYVILREKFELRDVIAANHVAGLVVLIGIAVLFALCVSNDIWRQSMVLYGFIFTAVGLIWGWSLVLLLRAMDRGDGRTWYLEWLGHGGLLLCSALLLAWDGPKSLGGRTVAAIWVASALSAIGFIGLSLCAFELVGRLASSTRDRSAAVTFLLLFTLGELLAFNKMYGYVGAPPFVQIDNVLPGIGIPIAGQGSARVPEQAGAANLNRNTASLVDGRMTLAGWSKGGAAPQLVLKPDQKGQVTAILTNHDADDAVLYRDISVDPDTGRFAFGAWLWAEKPGAVGIFLSTSSGPNVRRFHDGDGQWQWISVSVPVKPKDIARPHFFVKGLNTGHIQGARSLADMSVMPGADSIPEDGAAVHTAMSEAGMDLAQFRVNQPYFMTPDPNGAVLSNIPMVYRIRTYAGADSVINRNLYELLTTFEEPTPSWFTQQALRPNLTNGRLLDLLGVKYDIKPDGSIRTRPSALARFSLFEGYQVVPTREAMLQRLKESAFEPAKTVLLDAEQSPSVQTSANPAVFTPVPYASKGTDQLELVVRVPQPAILFFGDSYSKSWRAWVNDQEVPIHLADANFMAIGLPAGDARITFKFLPMPFMWLFRINLGLGAVLLLIAGYLSLRRFRAGVRQPVWRSETQ